MSDLAFPCPFNRSLLAILSEAWTGLRIYFFSILVFAFLLGFLPSALGSRQAGRSRGNRASQRVAVLYSYPSYPNPDSSLSSDWYISGFTNSGVRD